MTRPVSPDSAPPPLPALEDVVRGLFPTVLPRSGARLLGHLFGMDDLLDLYRSLRSQGERQPLAERLLTQLKVSYALADRDRDHVPKSGPVMVVCNHPFGLLEPAILLTVLTAIRPDVKFLANQALSVIPEILPHLIEVRLPTGSTLRSGNIASLRRALKFLSEGGLLVVFPSGVVSHFDWKSGRVRDPAWHPFVSRFARLTGCPVVPVFVQGANSLLFQVAGTLSARLRTALLPRELLNKRMTHVTLQFGRPLDGSRLDRFGCDREGAEYLRWRTYLLEHRSPFKARTRLPFHRRVERREPVVEIASPSDPLELQNEINRLNREHLLLSAADLDCYLATAREVPALLQEIGRLREISFRAAGEGTGGRIDLDRFDEHYLHLFLWNRRRREIVGAYRMAQTDQVLDQFGLDGLYTATLFNYPVELLRRMGCALELGRSFVRPEYQAAFAPLLLLWKGIGVFVARNPRYRWLFGPVSISNVYRTVSKQLIVSFLTSRPWLSEWAGWVKARRPFPPSRMSPRACPAGLDLEDLCSVVGDIENSGTSVPVLLRHYLKLGGQLLGFNVDRGFSDALDGLMAVDLTLTEPRLLERYMGKQEAQAFLNWHRGRSLPSHDLPSPERSSPLSQNFQ